MIFLTDSKKEEKCQFARTYIYLFLFIFSKRYLGKEKFEKNGQEI